MENAPQKKKRKTIETVVLAGIPQSANTPAESDRDNVVLNSILPSPSQASWMSHSPEHRCPQQLVWEDPPMALAAQSKVPLPAQVGKGR